MMTTTITKLCTNLPNKTLCEFELSRRPRAARHIAIKYHNEEFTFNCDEKGTKFDESAYAKLEAERRPRAMARMNKLKN